MPMNVLLGKPPKMHRDVKTVARQFKPLDLTGVNLQKAVIDVLSHPTVASKRFLITIGDRTVGGLSAPRPDGRPLAGAGGRLCAVTLADYKGFAGEAMSMGERTPLAAIDARGLGPHGGGRSHHQPAGRAHRTATRQAVGQLDGRLWRTG